MTDLERKKRSFSIESILHGEASGSAQLGHRSPPDGSSCHSQFLLPSIPPLQESSDHFSWISCTRYNPPRVQRDLAGNELPKKRKYLSRSPRIPFNSGQLAVLEGRFRHSSYLSGPEIQRLARELHMSDVRVKIWFQNRRAREKREKLAKTQTEVPDFPRIRSEGVVGSMVEVLSGNPETEDPSETLAEKA